ncbi:MAG: N-terminal cleavage protein [Desulfosporosinus sp. BRH_c37]|nr:MAG: N-terminal cleavage protein [Desulfosporosinus sp. BRH_c37]
MKITTERTNHSLAQGYVLLDVLFALFLFSLGFTVLFGLMEGAYSEAHQATRLMEGANFAQKTMDQLANHPWSENIARQACIPGGTVEGSDGKYYWLIRSDWGDIPQLLRVSVEVRWTERGNPSSFKLESLYAVE